MIESIVLAIGFIAIGYYVIWEAKRDEKIFQHNLQWIAKNAKKSKARWKPYYTENEMEEDEALGMPLDQLEEE